MAFRANEESAAARTAFHAGAKHCTLGRAANDTLFGVRDGHSETTRSPAAARCGDGYQNTRCPVISDGSQVENTAT
jgi:hypothetical protein